MQDNNSMRSQAKKKVLDKLKDALKDQMSGKLKKVSVMSDSSEGLKEGLETARDMMGGKMPSSEGADKTDLLDKLRKRRGK